MTRLALETGIAPSAWMAEPPAILATAIHIMHEDRRRRGR